jgi:hypothetical protein
MTFDHFKEVSKIYINKLKTSNHYVKATAFIFLGISLTSSIYNQVQQGHYSEHLLKYSLIAVALGTSFYLIKKESKRKLQLPTFLEEQKKANEAFEQYQGLNFIYQEKQKLDTIIKPNTTYHEETKSKKQKI